MAKCSTVGGGTPQSVTIDDLVKDYIEKRKKVFDTDLKRCSDINEVFNHPHQYRIAKVAKEQAEKKLKADKLWNRKYSSFEEVYDAVNKSIGSIRGIGKLAVYDVALRLGSTQEIHPQDRIYLSSDAKKGFNNLLKKILKIGVDVALENLIEVLLKKSAIVLTAELLKYLWKYFPALKKLLPMYLEDFLCIFDDKLMNIK